MPKKIRVHELAKELGMTNQQTLDLCVGLGMGVKSHSSSVEEAQADRARRSAEKKGLVGSAAEPVKVDDKPEKATEPEKVTEPKKVTETGKPEKTSSGKTSTGVRKITPKTGEKSLEERRAESRRGTNVRAEAEKAAQEKAPKSTAKTTTTAKSTSEISSSGRSVPKKRPAPVENAPAKTAAKAATVTGTQVEAKAAPVNTSGTPTGTPTISAPMSRSGKPIPPPPPPPIRHTPTTRQGNRNNRDGGRSGGGGTATTTTGIRRPPTSRGTPPGRGTGPGTGPPGRVGGRPGTRPGGGPGGRGRGSGPGGPGGQRRPPARRRRRRSRRREELQPMDIPEYTPQHAPVPEGIVVVERSCSAQDLGPKLNRNAADVVHYLWQNGEMVTATQSLSEDMIELFALHVGAEIRLVNPGEEQEVELQKLLGNDDLSDPEAAAATAAAAETRSPVVTVMGHVDHGKTLLLDRIRNANVVAGEAGGITQHIGAYQIQHEGQTITFIDTPGHEAFTAMRARGANSTDVVVLVVAADDGVMPQTVEAINHAKAADVPIIVAVNKIDRENADVDRAIGGVAEHDLVPEAWGGDTVYCEVSALESIGIEDLLEQIVLVAEVEDLKAKPTGRARGVVLEAHLDIGRGPVATLLVQHGTLNVGDPVVAGAAWGRVRALIDDKGENVESAGPSTPVQVLGMSEVAAAGDEFVVAPNERIANRVADTREHWQRLSSLGREAHALTGGAKLEDIFAHIRRGEVATLNVIIKADVNGSLEAVTESLRKLEGDEVRIGFVHRGVGGITENDIQLASASNASIIGFNVRPDRKARELAELERVEIRTYEIIYKLIEDVTSAMEGMLAPDIEEIVTGEAEVREIFRIPRIGPVAGCYVQSGTITRGAQVRFLREGTIIWKGTIASLKRFSDDAREVAAGYECGIGLANFSDLKAGDIIETFTEREIARTLDS